VKDWFSNMVLLPRLSEANPHVVIVEAARALCLLNDTKLSVQGICTFLLYFRFLLKFYSSERCFAGRCSSVGELCSASSARRRVACCRAFVTCVTAMQCPRTVLEGLVELQVKELHQNKERKIAVFIGIFWEKCRPCGSSSCAWSCR
jgi:hypothetical protein